MLVFQLGLFKVHHSGSLLTRSFIPLPISVISQGTHAKRVLGRYYPQIAAEAHCAFPDGYKEAGESQGSS